MRKAIIAVIILALILTTGILEAVYIEKSFRELDTMLIEARELIIDKDAEGALKVIDDTIVWWEKRKDTIELVTFSPDLRTLSSSLGETKGSLMCDDTKNALSKVESLLVISENVREVLNFNLRDVI